MITGIIMASGFAKRMMRDKLTLDIAGLPMVERVIRALLSSNINKVIIVYRENAIRKIAERYGIKSVYNCNAHKGQSSSIKIGLKAADLQTEGFAFFVGDQPFLSSCIINELIEVFKENKSGIVVPLYKGKKGNPVIFSSQFRDRLLGLEGDMGGRQIIEEMKERVIYVNINEELSGRDIDTWDDYIMIKKDLGGC